MKIAIVGPGALGCLIAAALKNKTKDEVWICDDSRERAARIEKSVKELFTRLGVSYPPDWRGTAFGARGGTEEQRTIASTVVLKDGRIFNSLGLTLRLLSEGREFGWTVTKSA